MFYCLRLLFCFVLDGEKYRKKMIKVSSSFKLNEIHRVDSPFNEDPKNIIFSRDALISGEGRRENLGKIGNNRDIYCYANWGMVNFERAYQPLPPGTKILVMPQFSYMPGQSLGKNEKSQNLTLFRVLPSQNIRTYSKNFYMAKRLWL